MYQLEFLILFSTLWCITLSAPSTSSPPLDYQKITTSTATVPDFLKPRTDAISVEGLNYLLRAAGNFFRPPLLIPDIPVGASHIDENIQLSSSSTLPPNHKFSPSSSLLQSSNYYIPLYSYENSDKDIKYDDEKIKSLLNIFPPDITNNNEPNYYEMLKPKKIPKKYSSTLKLINVKATTKNTNNNNNNESDSTISSLPAHNHRYTYEDSYLNLNNHQISVVPDNVSQDHDAQESQHQENDNDNDDVSNENNENNEKNEQEEEQQQEYEENEKDQQQPQQKQLENYEKEEKQKNENSNVNFQIPINYNYDDSDRIEYQVHGHNGPKSYKFGYDTGKGKNRQYRFEERDNSGNVIGEYGYINKKGQLTVIKYSSDAERGFQVENMH